MDIRKNINKMKIVHISETIGQYNYRRGLQRKTGVSVKDKHR